MHNPSTQKTDSFHSSIPLTVHLRRLPCIFPFGVGKMFSFTWLSARFNRKRKPFPFPWGLMLPWAGHLSSWPPDTLGPAFCPSPFTGSFHLSWITSPIADVSAGQFQVASLLPAAIWYRKRFPQTWMAWDLNEALLLLLNQKKYSWFSHLKASKRNHN